MKTLPLVWLGLLTISFLTPYGTAAAPDRGSLLAPVLDAGDTPQCGTSAGPACGVAVANCEGVNAGLAAGVSADPATQWTFTFYETGYLPTIEHSTGPAAAFEHTGHAQSGQREVSVGIYANGILVDSDAKGCR